MILILKDPRIKTEAVRVSHSGNQSFHLKDGDMVVNDEDVAKEMEFQKMCASGDCISMPAKQTMQIKVCLIFRNNHEFIFNFQKWLISSTDSL